jgi:hypothetical protein
MAILDKVFRWLGHGRYWSSLPTATSNGGVVELLSDAYGRLRVVVDSTTAPTAAVVSYHDTVDPADKDEIKVTGGTLLALHGFNDSESDTVYLQIHDASGEPDPDTVPVMVFRLEPGAHFAWGLDAGRTFTDGIYWATSSVCGGYTAVAGSVVLQAVYQ